MGRALGCAMGSQQSCYDDVFAGNKQSLSLFTVNFHSPRLTLCLHSEGGMTFHFHFAFCQQQLAEYAAYHVFLMSVLAHRVSQKKG